MDRIYLSRIGNLRGLRWSDEIKWLFCGCQGALSGFDVVYSSRFASYGSVPAALQASLGTVCSAFVTFLTRKQLEIMHRTEGVPHGLRHCWPG